VRRSASLFVNFPEKPVKMSQQVALFACSKCFSRHPFEELSPGQQLCKECRGAYPVVKCTYCRSEFQQTSKGSTSTICKKCDQNVKQYGKPSACELCCLLAAFIGNKCQRCTNSELKYGPPVTCEQCKQKSAFNRPDHKIDGKQLCWLCTLSYKRALAKAKQVQAAPRPKKRASTEENSGSKSSKGTSGERMKKSHRSETKPVIEIPLVKNASPAPVIDPHSSEHVVAMTQLKETIASLQKRLAGKDRELLQKDKEITELKGKHFTLETELRTKMKDQERLYEMKLELLNKKVAGQLKEIATLSKSNKRNTRTEDIKKEDKESEKENKSQSPKSQESPDTNKSPASTRTKSPNTSSSSDSDASRDD